MSPAEKAKDILKWLAITDLSHNMAVSTSLFLIEHVVTKSIPMYTGELNPEWKYWQEVKEELNKLRL